MTFCLLLALLAQVPPPGAQPAPRLSARLYAAQTAIRPGGQTEILVELEVPPPWHIYHPVILDTGLPTTIQFTGPPEAWVSDLRFPTPRLGEQAGIEYLELSGRVLVLGTLRVSEQAPPGKALRLKANVSALACIEQCVPVQAAAELLLPVQAEAGPAANEPLFEQARKALTPELAEAKYIESGSISIAPERLSVGQSGEIVARIRIQEGLHVQDRDPGTEFLIPSRVLVEPRNGLRIARAQEQTWPAAKVREIEGFGKVREQSGELIVRIPIQIVDPQFPSGPVELRALFYYQACNEQGQCFPPEFAAGVIRFTADTPNAADDRHAVYSVAPDGWVSAEEAAAAAASADSSSGPVRTGSPLPLWAVLGLAALGGLILNVMPCVLPVISLKVLSFVQQGGEDPGRALRLGLVFCLGILVWFWLFAALSMSGRLPLQYPSVVIGVGSALVVFALNLFGVFEITLPGAAAGKLDSLAAREGYAGAFLKGLLATLLGTACTAPFLGTALVYGATQPWNVALGVFTAAGIGMASPYLLLAMNPRWMKFIPRPGAWMVTFKQATGFVLLGTAVWLLTIVADQLGASGAVWTTAFWGFLGLACWLAGRARPTWGAGPRLAVRMAAAAVALLGGWFSYGVMYRPPEREWTRIDPDEVVRHVESKGWQEGIPWVPYAPGLAQELARRGYTVYVDYTASWCVNCQVNKSLVLETDAIRSKMSELKVIPIEADFTNRDPILYEEIRRRNRNSVPLNLILPAGRPEEEIILPVLLTQAVVTEALEKAGASRPAVELSRAAP